MINNNILHNCCNVNQHNHVICYYLNANRDMYIDDVKE